MDKIKSPITESFNVQIEESFPAATIIELYNESHIDVKRFFHNANVHICRCLDSGYRFYYPFDIYGDGAFYQSLRFFPGYFREWKWEYGKVSKLIDKGIKQVLEVGCGNGVFLNFLRKKGIDCVGLELNRESVEECKAKDLKVKAELLSEHKLNSKEKYDMVCSFQVLEHIPDVRGFIVDSLSVLKKGGLLVFAVPNNEAFLVKKGSGFFNMPPHHMGLWDKNSLVSLTKFFDVKIKTVSFEPLPHYEIERYRNLRFPGIINFGYKINWRLGFAVKETLSFFLRIFRYGIKGHTLVAVFEKL
jgi:SAM-dependent methyltransferase